MNMRDYKDYRSTALQKICTNQRIKDLLTNQTNSTASPSSLVGNYVYSFNFIPGTTETAKTFITMVFSTPVVKGMTAVTSRLVFNIFTHESLMRVQDPDNPRLTCDRLDQLAIELDEMFNGSLAFGFKLELVSRKDGSSPMDKFHGISLVYETSSWNRKAPSIR